MVFAGGVVAGKGRGVAVAGAAGVFGGLEITAVAAAWVGQGAPQEVREKTMKSDKQYQASSEWSGEPSDQILECQRECLFEAAPEQG